MKKITIIVGPRREYRQIGVEDIGKIYYLKIKTTPRLPKFMDETVEYQGPTPKIAVEA